LNLSVQQSDQVMTEKEYYLWSNKFKNWCIHASVAAFFAKIYIAAFVFGLLQMKINKMKEVFGGLEFGLTEMCFPFAGL